MSFPHLDRDEPLSVSELNRRVGALLERSFPLLWVRGEVSNLTRAASGHWYFLLKDRDAQVRCVMFKSRNSAVDWKVREGDLVEARITVSLYAARGEFQLSVEQLRRYGAGALYERFLQLKAQLEAEGLLHPDRKRPVPRFPRRLGLVTSLQAAALSDVLTALSRRAPHIEVIIYPTAVQGRSAHLEIAQAIDAVTRRHGQAPEIDVLLVVRGGGSIEDLWSFNEEIVARAIAKSPVPVVTGIGHETDFTIADFVADLRGATPTAAAELVSPDARGLARRLGELQSLMSRRVQRLLERREQRLDDVARRLRSPGQQLLARERHLTALSVRLESAVRRCLERRSSRLETARHRLQATRPNIERAHEKIGVLAVRLSRSHASGWQQRHALTERLAAQLRLLDPQSALDRGFALVQDTEGRLIRDAASVKTGQPLKITVAKGEVDATVVSHRGPVGKTA